jgi:hypothetical protein
MIIFSIPNNEVGAPEGIEVKAKTEGKIEQILFLLLYMRSCTMHERCSEGAGLLHLQ